MLQSLFQFIPWFMTAPEVDETLVATICSGQFNQNVTQVYFVFKILSTFKVLQGLAAIYFCPFICLFRIRQELNQIPYLLFGQGLVKSLGHGGQTPLPRDNIAFLNFY
jgi:hypothetical protein